MVNVDITAQVKATPTAQTQAPRPTDKHVADKAAEVQDQVDFSTKAKKLLKEALEGQTIAEAWMKHVIEDNAKRPQESSKSDNQDPKDKDQKGWRQQAMDATNLVADDIKWLLAALGLDPTNPEKLLQAVQSQAVSDLTTASVAPIVINATAPQVQTLYVEGISLTVHGGDLTQASVKRVSVTTVHGSNIESIATQDQPTVIDLGGQLQAPTASGKDAQGNPGADKAEEIFRTGTSPTDLRYAVAPAAVRHGLLIVHEGGRPQADTTVKLRLDALMPLTGTK